MKKLPISLVIITLNEEQNIARCIKSAPFVSEIVVLDSGSQDATGSIAQSLGARVFVESWQGYFKQKLRATELALHPWILSLDADEALSPELAREIQGLEFFEGSDLSGVDGFEMPRLSFHLGRWIRHGGWYPDRQLRLFHRDRAQWQGGMVHERVAAKKVRRLQGDLYHFVFQDLADQVSTNNEYSGLGAQDLKSRGKRFSLTLLLLKPWSKFIETYFFKAGFRDGLPGFIISVGAAYSMFLKYAKLWEMEKRGDGLGSGLGAQVEPAAAQAPASAKALPQTQAEQ